MLRRVSTRVGTAALGCAVAAVVLSAVVLAAADEPVFVRWLVSGDPGDETIREYWERAERGELSPPALVDLGTMLFYRGFPKDAVRMYKRALDVDSDLYEAWFRIGLVEHSEGDLNGARKAYKRCLKKRPGHGWCNFYLGLLEEQLGHSSNALYHYRRAFKFAPELADPDVNPEVMSSGLVLGATLQDREWRRFKDELPMRYLEAGEVRRVMRKYELTPTPVPKPAEAGEPTPSTAPPQGEMRRVEPQPTPVRPVRPPRPPVPRRAPQPTPEPDSTGSGSQDSNIPPYGMPMIEDASSEARLAPRSSAPRMAGRISS